MEQTIREALTMASSLLEEHDVKDARFQAELVIRNILNLDRAQFFSRLSEPFPRKYEDKLQKMLKKRMQGEPLQYILGGTEFYGRYFQVDSHVLIPRPETELLVEKTVHYGEELQKPVHIVEVGTGSGIIATTLALIKPNWHITAIDISSDALRVAKKNAQAYGVDENIHWLHGPYLSPLPQENPIDILISNPPYIPSGVINTLDRGVKDFEPTIALDGGSDGLDAYREIIFQIKKRKPKLLSFEIGSEQALDVKTLILQAFPKASVSIFKDLAGHDRIVIGKI